jgi:hypothetical protein
VTAREEPADGTAERPYPIGQACMDCGKLVIGLPTQIAILPHDPTCPRVRHISPSNRLSGAPHIEIAVASNAGRPSAPGGQRHGESCPDCPGVVEVHNELTFLIHAWSCRQLAIVDVALRIGEGPTRLRRAWRPRLLIPRVPTTEQEIPRAIAQLFARFAPPPRKRRDP